MNPTDIAKFLESGMLVAFGFAWPTSIANTLRYKSVRGKSLSFLIIVFLGYLFGIAAKILGENINYVLFFYILNASMVLMDLCLYYYYWEKERDKGVLGG
ncbi:MAG: hypothetical protein LBG06_10420 [Deltaproteobacteria bacterium]|jgi:hypothetical protein|nr:hypothetical protein [Deltaproteobacteria bacterium]